MATPDLVKDLVTCFWKIKDRQTPADVIEAWHRSLKCYSDKQVKVAGHLLIDTWTSARPPTPADLIKLIPVGELTEVEYSFGKGTCEQCGAYANTTIKEPRDTGIWLCRQCYTGLTSREIKARFKTLSIGSAI